MRLLEDAKIEREKKAREIDRAYSLACIDAIQSAFALLDVDVQKQVEDEFLESESFGSFQITDFRRNGWASRMILSPAIKFWMGRKAPLPHMSDVSKKFGVEDFEAFKTETDRIGQELEKA